MNNTDNFKRYLVVLAEHTGQDPFGPYSESAACGARLWGIEQAKKLNRVSEY